MKGLLSLLAGAADQLDIIPGFDPVKDKKGLLSALLTGGQQPTNPNGLPGPMGPGVGQSAAPGGAVPQQRLRPPNPADYRTSYNILDVFNPFKDTNKIDNDDAFRFNTAMQDYTAAEALRASQAADAKFAQNAQTAGYDEQAIARMNMARNAGDSPFGKQFSEGFGFNKLGEGDMGQNFGGEFVKNARTHTPTDPAQLAINQQNADSNTVKADAAMHSAKNPRGPLVTIGSDEKPSVFEEAVDRAAAESYIEWTQGGGSDAVKQLSQVGEVLDRLKAGEDLTGPLLGLVPTEMRALFNQGSVDAQQLIEEVVQRNLRLILGAQFTEKEGLMLIRRAYNPQLDESVNAKRLARLFRQMETAARQKQAQMDYLEQNRTLRGYQGATPAMADFFSALDEMDAGANSPDWTPDKERRLQELRAKQAAGALQ